MASAGASKGAASAMNCAPDAVTAKPGGIPGRGRPLDNHDVNHLERHYLATPKPATDHVSAEQETNGEGNGND